MSLYARLAWWLGASLALLVLLHGLITERAPRLTTEDYIATRLEHDAEWLSAALRLEDGRPWLETQLIPPIYLRPGSGHYYTFVFGGHLLISPSSSGRALPMPKGPGVSEAAMPRTPQAPAHEHGSAAQSHGEEPLLILRRDLPEGGTLLLAESLDDLMAHLASFRTHFITLSLALFLLLLGGQFLLLRWLLQPVKQLERDTQRLERNELQQLPLPRLNELRPLVRALNALLERQTRRIERSRHALADLAHALKTPLAALRQSLPTPLPTEVEGALQRIEDIIQRELRHARWSEPGTTGLILLDAVPTLEELLQTMRRVHRDRELTFEMQAPAHLWLPLDREALLELFGNLLDNAGKWAKTRARLTLCPEKGQLMAFIEDDGPGTDIERLNQDTPRGQRLDESRPGHGLGLSIVRQIVAAYGGSLHFAPSPELGGLRVEVRLPLQPH